MHAIIEKNSLSCLPVYETGLPAKSDHFFTSASLMTSLLLSTTMAEKNTGMLVWWPSEDNYRPKPFYKKLVFIGEYEVTKSCMITCVSTFEAVDVSVPLCQTGQVNWQVIVCHLHHVAYGGEAGRTREGRRGGAGKELMETLQQSRISYWGKGVKKDSYRSLKKIIKMIVRPV